MLNGLDLFSGIGGISIALSPWVKPIAYCENESYAQGVLLSRMAEGYLPVAPIWDDIRTLKADMLPCRPDIIYGGFPCQDISTAGHGVGLEGERSGLFYEIVRLAEEIKPTFIFLENVPAIRTRGLREVGKQLATLRYDCRWGMLSAYDMGAPHYRERWFLLGYTKHHGLDGSKNTGSNGKTSDRRSQSRSYSLGESQGASGVSGNVSHSDRIGLWDWSERSQEGKTKADHLIGDDGSKEYVANSSSTGDRKDSPAVGGDVRETWARCEQALSPGRGSPDVANSHVQGLEVGEQSQETEFTSPFGNSWWEFEPDVGRVVNGLPNRVDRIRCLGNAVVPVQVREAFKRLVGDYFETKRLVNSSRQGNPVDSQQQELLDKRL